MQEVEITDFCSRRGWEYKIYRDAGQSGAKESRPALDSLLSDVRKRRVDVLVVWALDRLARSLKQLLSIAEECRSLGVDLVSLKQAVDTTLPAGRLNATERYQPAASSFEAGGPQNRRALAELAYTAADARYIASASRGDAQGRPSAARAHQTLDNTRSLHSAIAQSSAGGGRKSCAYGDHW
jgi:hypothetical protein